MAEHEVKLTKLAKCAGCGAKVGAGVLSQLLEGIRVHEDPRLLVGFDKSDDASVYQISDDLALVQTVDFFPPIADDPYLFGQIAATNALSDVYAMGGEPKLCLNIMAVPDSMPKEAVHEMLRGGYDKVYEAGALITGGHSILDDEPKYGLCVTGFVHPDRILTNSGARPGDVLLLTKPLGVGIVCTAARVGEASQEALDAAKTEIDSLLAQWEGGAKTAESFGALALEHSDDSGSASNGGLMENVYPGATFPAFNDWCMDPARQPGDTTVVENPQEGQQGWHLIYFDSWQPPLWKVTADTALRNDKMTDWMDSLVEGLETTRGDGEGKSPVGRPGPVTPWGKPALGYKTRKKKNRTDKFIVRRRNGK